MTKRELTYYFLGKLLSIEKHPKHKEEIVQTLLSPGFNWDKLIVLASNHLVLQTIYVKIRDLELLGYLPIDVKVHLEMVYQLNLERNTKILFQVKEINELLTGKGIIPMFLKGCGNILDNLYSDPGERILHDIDVLIKDCDINNAVELLLNAGYKFTDGIITDTSLLEKHLTPMYKPGCVAQLELHRNAVSSKYLELLPTPLIWQNAHEVNYYGVCMVMNCETAVNYNFIHSQLVHNGNKFANISYRNLYDLFLHTQGLEPKAIFKTLHTYKRAALGYYKVMQKVFWFSNSDNQRKFNQSSFFVFRHTLNVKFRLATLVSFYFTTICTSYVYTPLKALSNRKLFVSLVSRLVSVNWYRSHFKNYKRIYTRISVS